ncbi:hypothetical protein Acr_29g0006210 [Actinidia rufa]|uniref:Uncharacterized protein n=1 Tax=Actinidia rufa TaxID=165716 RepID=A0A7J0HEG4_9ERIC|nr:hypothetical protein Acr_29g0006210 [Actinidia rufa]
MIIKGRSLIQGGLIIEKRREIRDLTEIQIALTIGILALHLAAPSLFYHPSMLPLPKDSRILNMKNLSNGLGKSRLTPKRETGTNIANSTETTGTNREDCFQLKEQIADLIKRDYLRKYVATYRLISQKEDMATTDQLRVIFKQFTVVLDQVAVRPHPGKGMPGVPIDRPKKKSTISPRVCVGDHPPITFSNDDLRGLHLPHNDALVVYAVIANFNVQRILIDNGSSADILFISAFERMKIGLDKLHPFHTPLIGFGGNITHPLG